MVQTIKKEKLIAQTYMNEVVPRNGVINLYKDDYLTMAEQHRPLADAHVPTHSHPCQVINPNILANPAIVTNFKIPRVFNVYARLYDHIFANLGTE